MDDSTVADPKAFLVTTVSRLRWPSGRAVLLDLGLKAQPKDVLVVSDLDEGGFLERYSMPDPSLAPPGHSLVQAELPMRDGESQVQALSRLERLADLGVPGWRQRVTWRREATANQRTGALDRPGVTWRDRPRRRDLARRRQRGRARTAQ